MKRIVLLLASLVCFAANAKITTADCLATTNGAFSSTSTFMSQDFAFLGEKLQYNKIQVKLLYEEKIASAFADYLARQDIISGRNKIESPNKISQRYMNDNARNLVAEITYFNQQNKKIVILGSAYINDKHCGISSAPKDYLLIKREF